MESNHTKDKIIAMVLHDLRSPLRFLNTITSRLTSDHVKEQPETVAPTLALLKGSTKALNDFTEQFFAWVTSQQQEFKVVKEIFPLQPLFDELEDLYKDIVTINENYLVINPTQDTACTDRNILSVILRNLLDNANKNTRKGSIKLSAEKAENHLLIAITDTGAGMGKYHQEDLF